MKKKRNKKVENSSIKIKKRWQKSGKKKTNVKKERQNVD